MEIAAGIFFLALFTEGLVEYALSGTNKYVLRFVPLAIGVGLAIAYRVNIPEAVGISSQIPYINYIVSGVVIGRGSNYLNDLVSYFRKV